jgi:NADPH-dependent F420 reductase
MTRIAILGGTGHQGYGLGLRLAQAGFAILIGSRSREKASQAAERMNAELTKRDGLQAHFNVLGLDNVEAVYGAEIVFMTVPYPAGRDIVHSIKDALRGKIFVDISVPLVRFKPPAVQLPLAGSVAQEFQELLGSPVTVIGAFKTNSAIALQDLDRPMESDVFVCGDSGEAKEQIIELAQRMGMRAFDAGPLENAAVLEQLTALLIHFNQRYKKKDIGIRLTDV